MENRGRVRVFRGRGPRACRGPERPQGDASLPGLTAPQGPWLSESRGLGGDAPSWLLRKLV